MLQQYKPIQSQTLTVETTGGLLESFAKFLFVKLSVLLDNDTGKEQGYNDIIEDLPKQLQGNDVCFADTRW